jgi:hypothetical protein
LLFVARATNTSVSEASQQACNRAKSHVVSRRCVWPNSGFTAVHAQQPDSECDSAEQSHCRTKSMPTDVTTNARCRVAVVDKLFPVAQCALPRFHCCVQFVSSLFVTRPPSRPPYVQLHGVAPRQADQAAHGLTEERLCRCGRRFRCKVSADVRPCTLLKHLLMHARCTRQELLHHLHKVNVNDAQCKTQC